MQKLSYLKPETLPEALELMERYAGKIKPYAGGTDLMVQLREEAKRLVEIEYLMDVGALKELKGIEVLSDRISIGAATSHTKVSVSEVIREHAAFLAAAASTVGSPQIRNNGTVGGNICNGSPAADTLSPFVALAARLRIVSKSGGERTELVKDIYLGANKVTLKPDDLVTRIEFDRIDGYQTSFIKLGRRKALAISRLNTAAALKMEGGIIKDARLAPGCIFAVPDRVEAVEQMLIGQAPSKELFAECGRKVSEEMIARTGIRWSTEYKKPAIEAIVERALAAAAAI